MATPLPSIVGLEPPTSAPAQARTFTGGTYKALHTDTPLPLPQHIADVWLSRKDAELSRGYVQTEAEFTSKATAHVQRYRREVVNGLLTAEATADAHGLASLAAASDEDEAFDLDIDDF